MRASRAGLRRPEDLQRILAGQRVLEVSIVDQVGDLLRRHFGQQPPHRFPGHLRGEIPGGVDDRSDRHVHHALLRAEPAELAVGDQGRAESAEVIGDVMHGAADNVRAEGLDRGDDDIVATADREAQRVSGQAGGVGGEDRVRGGVVRIGVHRIRTVVVERGREPDVETVQRDDPGLVVSLHGHSVPLARR